MIKLMLTVCGAAVLAVACGSVASDSPTTTVGVGPVRAGNGMAVWVENAGSGTVTPINTATATAGRPVRVPASPSGLAITPDGKTAYVANGADKVTPIHTATGRVGRVIRAHNGSAITMTPNGKTVYVAASGSITPISVATGKTEKPVRVTKGDGPEVLAVSPDSRTVYAVNTTTVVPVDTGTNRVGKPIYVGETYPGMVVTPDGTTGYVLGLLDTVIPINAVTNSAGKPIKVGGQRPGPAAIAISPDGRTVYIANDGNGTVVPISTATNKAGKPIKVGPGPRFIAITPDGKTAYVATAQAVYPINIATGAPGKAIRVERFSPGAIAISADGRTAWVSGDIYKSRGFSVGGRGFVLPINTATNTAGKLIKVGDTADCLVIVPWRASGAQGPSSCEP